jgi:hypothetical protein
VVTGMYRPGDGTRLTSRTPAGTAPDTIALTEVELP